MTLERERAAEVFSRATEAIQRADHQDSRRLLLEVAQLDRQLGNRTRLAEALVLLSENYAAGGRFDSAALLASEAHALYATLGDKQGVRTAVLARARVHELCGEWDEAYALLLGALQVEEALGNRPAAQDLKWKIVPVARGAGNPEAERRFLRQLMSEYASAGDKRKHARAAYDLGVSYLSANQLQSARKHLTEARMLALAGSDTLLTIAILQMDGVAAQREGNTTEALRSYSAAMRLSDIVQGAQRLREELLLRTGNLLLAQRRYADAIKYYNVALRSAIQTQHRLIEAYALLQLGHCSSGLQRDDAGKEYEAGAELMAQIGIPASNAYAAVCRGRHALAIGQPSRAVDYFRQAVEAYDSSVTLWDPLDVFADCEAAALGGTMLSPYNDLIEISLRLGRPEDAFLATERKNRIHLFKNISRLRIRLRNASGTAGLAAFRQLLGMYAGVERQLAAAFSNRAESVSLTTELHNSLRTMRSRLVDTGDSLVVTLKAFGEILAPAHPTLAEIQQLIPADAVLLAYHPAPRFLQIFTVSRKGFSSDIGAAGREALLTMINSHLATLQRLAESDAEMSQHDKSTLAEQSTKLYAAMLLPVEHFLTETVKILVMLPTDIPLLPLHAVSRDKHSGPLVEKSAIRYVTDAGMLAGSAKRVSASPTGVAFGNRGATTWDVEYELSDLRLFVKDVRFYIDNLAMVSVLRTADGDLLHAVLDVRSNWRHPDRSYIVLNSGPGYGAMQYRRLGELFALAPFPAIMLSNLSEIQLHAIVPKILRMNGTSEVVLNCFVPSRKAKKEFAGMYYPLLLAGNSVEQSCRQAVLTMRRNAEFAGAHVWGAYMVW